MKPTLSVITCGILLFCAVAGCRDKSPTPKEEATPITSTPAKEQPQTRSPQQDPGSRAVPDAVETNALQATARLASTNVLQPGGAVRLYAHSGGKVRIEGTSNIHDWQVESPLIGGWLEVDPARFPLVPGQGIAPGRLQARAEAFVTARSLRSLDKSGQPYSDKMDEIMHEKLQAQQHPRIQYYLRELDAANQPGSGEYTFIAAGELVAAGVSNLVTCPVTVTPLTENRVKISGVFVTKMTDFKIQPPTVTVVGPLITTGDSVTLRFEWVLAPKPAAVAKSGQQE